MSDISNTGPVKQFIAIDDDAAVLFLSEVIIKRTIKEMVVVVFNNPQLAVDYFKSGFTDNPIETIVLLDINMPELTGWEVLDNIGLLSEETRRFINVFMLSSSVDPNDRQRAIKYPFVKDFLEKPLSIASLDLAMNKFRAEILP